ncbi:hypothetical protein [Parasphingorhabdus cellanae]|uniref:Uncharacterized protein n=1 Tax=Parasphingorhabdus cellanae TaxID=2806553 RepID=A0ABX7T0I7_9SPHN|nr:hypothetical protein [Parasphingorhabdus cellanae]QTD55056.1 hypothetical protein J4G78_12570 [Parasphingorhabdus cellanae]
MTDQTIDNNDDTPGKPISIVGAIFAILISGAVALGYGAAAAFFPLTIVDLIFLFISAIFIFAAYAMIGQSRMARLVVAIPGGLVCLSMMWFGWFWVQIDYDAAMAVLAGGPGHAFTVISEIADGTSYTAGRGFRTDVEVGSGRIKLFWTLESLGFLLLPAVGAWLGMSAGDADEGHENAAA